MRFLVILTALAFLTVCPSLGVGQLSKPVLPTGKQTDKFDESKEAVIVEQNVTRATWEADGTGTRETTGVVRVQAESGVQQLGVLRFLYTASEETVDVDYVRVRKPDGTVVATPAYNIQEMPGEVTRSAPMYSDIREKHVTVKGLGVGDVLEYTIRYRTVSPQVPGQFWFEYTFEKFLVTKDEELWLSVPAGKYVNLSSPGLQPSVSEEAGHRIYHWKTANLEPKKRDKQRKRDAPPPSLVLSTFRTWDEVGRWYGALQAPQAAVTPAIRAKAAELTQGVTGDEARIRALYNFVSTRFHYVSLSFGIGRYQPHAADEVLDNGYGDCKDKHTLLAALLKAAGYDAWPALINTTRKITADVPSPGAFDHMFTAVPRGSSLLWLDTTPEVSPFGLLLANLRDKQALVISGEKATLITTPANPPFPSSQTFVAEGKLSSDGTFTGHVQRTARGDAEVLYRLGFRATAPQQWKELVQQVSYASGFGGEVAAVSASKPEDIDKPFEFSYDYTRKEYGGWQDRRITPPLPPFGIEVAPGDDTKPDEPVILGALGDVLYRAKMELPAGYTLAPPSPVDLVTDYAEYHAQYSFDKGVMKAERRFVIKKYEVPLADWDGYSKFRKAITDDEGHWIDLAERDASGKLATALPKSNDADTLNNSGRAALDARDFSRAADLLNQAVKADPRHKWAWNNLGLAYIGMRRLDDAASALRRQIEVSPNDQYAYNNLGRVLSMQGNYDEAARAFEKQIAINPQDRWAHSNLGALLLRQKEYDDAIRELQAAVAIPGKDPNNQFLLGQAYLGIGQTEKAMAALDLAVQELPSPMMLNNVAYVLAEKGGDLDKARAFAESAVSSLNGMLLGVKLNKLQMQDVALVNLLGMTWDTLGWIYFQQGDLAQADRYLAASWNLSQDGVVGDHLGQVYEKQGRKTEAAHQYAQSIAAPGTPAETRARLVALAGDKQADAAVRKAREEISRARSITVSRSVPRQATAEFFISFMPGGKVDEVKFVTGDQQLRDAEKELAALKYNIVFPDVQPSKLIRRGILACTVAGAACQFVLLLPSSVTSVD